MGGESRLSDPTGTKSNREVDSAVEQAQVASANQLRGFGQQLFNLGAPLLGQANQGFSDEIANLTALNDPITIESLTANPSFGALKGAIEGQFSNARRSAIATGGEGGALTGVLGGLEGARAAALAQGLGGLANQEQSRRIQNIAARTGVLGSAGQLGLGETGQAGQAALGAGGVLGQLGATQGRIAQANIAGDTQAKGDKLDFNSEQMSNVSSSAGAIAGGK